MAPEIEMRPVPVDTAGAELEQLANEAKAETGRLFESSDAAATGNPGWLSSPALRSCGNAWHGRLRTLVDQTSQAGKDLSDSASATSHMDREATDRLTDVLETMS